jgi:hypothetical protein
MVYGVFGKGRNSLPQKMNHLPDLKWRRRIK